jgi:adenylate kinase
MSKFCLILFGPPGSGKGTQARLVRQHFGWPHISTGDMLREHVQARDELGREIAEVMRSGRLVSDELVNRLVEVRTAQPDCDRGFILDGYPRTVPQARMVEQMLAARGVTPVVAYLKVDYNKIVARLTGRRLCPQCGALYSRASNAPIISEVCDYDGARLIVRDDDREDVIRERLEAYERQSLPLIDHFRQAGVAFYEIDASDGTPQMIFERMRAVLPVSYESEIAPAAGTGLK